MHQSEAGIANVTKPRGRSFARLLVFVGIAAITFAAGLYFWPSAVRGYLVRATIELSSHGSDAASQPAARRHEQLARDAVLADDQLVAALRHIGPPPHVPRNMKAEFPAQAEIDFIKQRLTIAPIPAQTAGVTRLAVSFTGHDAVWSVLLVERLVRQALDALDKRPAEAPAAEHMATERQVSDARRREQQARAALDEFLAQHFEALNRQQRRVKAATVSRAPQPRLNPQWQATRDQLTQLTDRYEQMLLRRTPEHPQAKDAALEIETTRRQLEALRQFLDPEVASPAPREMPPNTVQPVGPAQYAQAESATDDHPAHHAGHEYESLMAEFHQARQAREAAEFNADLAEKVGSRSAKAAQPVVRGRIVANAQLAQTLWEAPSASRLTVLALASIFVGACVATMFRSLGPAPVLESVPDVETNLSLAVVGVVPAPSRSTAPLSR